MIVRNGKNINNVEIQFSSFPIFGENHSKMCFIFLHSKHWSIPHVHPYFSKPDNDAFVEHITTSMIIYIYLPCINFLVRVSNRQPRQPDLPHNSKSNEQFTKSQEVLICVLRSSVHLPVYYQWKAFVLVVVSFKLEQKDVNRKVGIVFDIVECPVDHLSGVEWVGGEQESGKSGKSGVRWWRGNSQKYYDAGELLVSAASMAFQMCGNLPPMVKSSGFGPSRPWCTT